MYYNYGIAIAKEANKAKTISLFSVFAFVGLQKTDYGFPLLYHSVPNISLTTSAMMTFPGFCFSGEWSPCMSSNMYPEKPLE